MDVLRKISGEGVDDFRAILDAHLRAQNLKASRITVLHVLAIAGGLCWVLMTWPAALPPGLRLLALLAWPIALLAAVLVGLLEWKWDTRLSRLTRR